jgi:chromosomal replication initiation ATPase DnaA
MHKVFFSSITPLYHKNKVCVEDFILSDKNQQAFLYLSKWPNWYGNACTINGSKGSGKSFLARIWRQKSQAYNLDLFHLNKNSLDKALDRNFAFVVDNFDKYLSRKEILRNLENNDFENFEEVLIKIFDHCQTQNKHLLIVLDNKLAEYDIKTADLKSRLLAANNFTINAPDESTIKTYLIKLFAQAQLKISIDVTNYISKNITRSFKEVDIAFKKIDLFSLEEKRNITIPLVKKVLGC